MQFQRNVCPPSSAFLAGLSPVRRLARAGLFAALAALGALTGAETASAQNYGRYRADAVSSPSTLTVHHYYVPPTQFAADDTATVEVRLPEEADLRFNGVATRQTGGQRVFTTPRLQSGQRYEYDVAARWFEDGREVRVRQRISLRAGERLVVDFLELAAAPHGMAVREFPPSWPAGDGATRPASFEHPAAGAVTPGPRRLPGRMSIIEFP